MHTAFAVTTYFRHARSAAARLAIPLALVVTTFAPFQTSFAVPIYIALSAGSNHTCALLNNGGVQCWGSNSDGQLGNDNLGTDSNLPVNVDGITNALAIGSGAKTTCARLVDNTFRCWGDSVASQLGNGSNDDSGVPVQVSDITSGSLITGGDTHMCARVGGGAVSCWGNNVNGQLGIGLTGGGSLGTPQSVTGLSGVTAIGLGANHSCARLTDSTLRCWGSNSSGQLGNNTTTDSNAPTPVNLITTAVTLEGGAAHTCARLSDSSVACWGSNSFGQLGDGTTTQRRQPVPVSGISTAASVALGGNFSCARLSNGTVQCWGAGGNGQQGNGAINSNPNAVAVSGLTAVLQITAGSAHACALVNTGRIVCWGANASGQLGNGTNTNASTPRAVRDGRCTLDIDGDGVVGATTDMLMLTRASLGMGGTAVTQNAVGSSPLRGDWTAIRPYLINDCGMTNLAP